MTIEQFKSAQHSQPFRPFTIYMNDGRAFFVESPDFICRSPTGKTAIVFGDDDGFHILDMLSITRLEIHPTSSSDGYPLSTPL